MMQFFGIRAAMSGDPSRFATLGEDIEWIANRVFIPASLLAFVSGVLLVDRVGLLRLRGRLDRHRSRVVCDDVPCRAPLPRAGVGPRREAHRRGVARGRPANAAASAARPTRSRAALPHAVRHDGEAGLRRRCLDPLGRCRCGSCGRARVLALSRGAGARATGPGRALRASSRAPRAAFRRRRGRLRRRAPPSRRPSKGECTGISIFIASSATRGWRARTGSPGATSSRITVPGIGAVTVLSPCTAPGRCDSTSMSGGRHGGGVGRLSRHGVLNGGGGAADRRVPRAAGARSEKRSLRLRPISRPDAQRASAGTRGSSSRPSTRVVGESCRERVERVLARRPVGDELRDHRVVGEPDLVAFSTPASTGRHVRAGRCALDDARSEGETTWILGIESNLDRVSLCLVPCP